MIISVGVDGRYQFSFDELERIAVAAGDLGFDGIWTNAVGLPDPFHVCSSWSRATSQSRGGTLRTGISVIGVPRNWNLQSLVSQAATVGTISNGEFVLGIGTGGLSAQLFESIGLPNRPIAIMEDYLRILRPALRGEKVSYQGKVISIDQLQVTPRIPIVPVYIAALGPQMLRLAGREADGASLSFATPEEIRVSAGYVAEGASEAGREPHEITLSMYIRVCVDEDVDAARQAFGEQILSYALARPGVDKRLGYRGLFSRMGFGGLLDEMEVRRERGASVAELVLSAPDDFFSQVGYYGPDAGAAARYAQLSKGLDETIVRVITTKPGIDAFIDTMRSLSPTQIRLAGNQAQ